MGIRPEGGAPTEQWAGFTLPTERPLALEWSAASRPYSLGKIIFYSFFFKINNNNILIFVF
jgi:hypothetical protein